MFSLETYALTCAAFRCNIRLTSNSSHALIRFRITPRRDNSVALHAAEEDGSIITSIQTGRIVLQRLSTLEKQAEYKWYQYGQ
jgi:hypothetical protein